MTETIETEILIDAPPERVWAALADYAAYPSWNPYIFRIEGSASAGSVITVHASPAPGAEPLVQEIRVIAVEPPASMRWEGGLPDRAQFLGDHRWTLEAEGAATRLRQFEHFSGALAPAVLGRHRDLIRGNFVRFNEALKAHVEGARP